MSSSNSRQTPLSPPPELEDAVVARLRERGLLRRASLFDRSWRPVASVAALLLAFLAGAASTSGRPLRGTHLLLLEHHDESLAAEELEQRIAEYAAWADGLARDGALVAAERLGAGGWGLGDEQRELMANEPMAAPSGFFVLEAESEEEARRLAASCPHLRHGGSARLRPIAR